MLNNNHIVIMAGGIGSRFWPMSTPGYPKQFIDVMGIGKSLLQLTIERFLPLCPIENFWIVTNEKYVDIVKEQLPDIPIDNVLAEPVARNTAPCIAYACWKIKKKYPNANVVITPSDALVLNNHEFLKCINLALEFTEKSNSIVTIGIKPTRAETGYGYIHAIEKFNGSEIYKVQSFKEKPSLETAKNYITDGNYFWNAGIFVWNVNTITHELKTHMPKLVYKIERMAESFYSNEEKNIVAEVFPTCEKISIDYAVMEKSQNIYTLPYDFGWSDLGSWGSLHSLLNRDNNNNAVVGNRAKLFNCSNCIVHVSKDRDVVLEGLDGYIVAERNNSILVCNLSEEQRIKEFTQE